MSRLVSYSLSPRARRLLASLVPVVCPEGATRLGLAGALVDHAELGIRSFPRAVRAGLVVGMRAYDEAARAWPRARGRSAGRLDPERAAAYFESWYHSRLLPRRELAGAMKKVLVLAYYEMPAVQAELGYAPQARID
jgi:hypothetical protein